MTIVSLIFTDMGGKLQTHIRTYFEVARKVSLSLLFKTAYSSFNTSFIVLPMLNCPHAEESKTCFLLNSKVSNL